MRRPDEDGALGMRDHRASDAAQQRRLSAAETAAADHDRVGVKLVGELADGPPRLPSRHPGGGLKSSGLRQRDSLLSLIAGHVGGDLIKIELVRDQSTQRR